MGKYISETSNYDKSPYVQVPGESCLRGWGPVMSRLCRLSGVIVFECYQGVHDAEVLENIRKYFPDAQIFLSSDAMKPERELKEILGDDITDDEIFGYMTRHTMEVYFDERKTKSMRDSIYAAPGRRVVYGTGASFVTPNADALIYLDMARWEIQMRFRRHEVSNVGFNNSGVRPCYLYKQGFFVDWRILDRWKKKVFSRIDYILDTNTPQDPKLITRDQLKKGLRETISRPFRVVPYFDPGVWGGQWMKEVCDLDASSPNYAWCFDCVPEENSLYLRFGDTCVEIPSIDLVFMHPRELLGDSVYGRFGDEFPIRFDFLDTMEGGNLSLQVHPLIQYIQEKFGMHYTQEESYYILDAAPDAHVYLGVKEGIDPYEMIKELENGDFHAEKFVGRYPVKKHDHVLIPPGTIHCSGANSMVLEISATPYIFTFKLHDWGRVGLDGLPRPINIGHGSNVIQWDRTEKWVRSEGINSISSVSSGDGWTEERTGLHSLEFIETRRHWFTSPVNHNTGGSVNVLNLVEGREAIVESPCGAFLPYRVHYAETFIVPAAVGEYTIRPAGPYRCATVKAFVRH